MAKFKVKAAHVKTYVLTDDEGVWAKFVDGVFETSEKKVIDRLRKVEDVEEVGAHKAEKPAVKSAPAKDIKGV